MDIIKNIIKNNVVVTGVINNCSDNDYSFKHLVITKEQLGVIYNEKCSLEGLCKLYGIDFISIKEEGDLSFLHISYVSKMQSIKEHGLMCVYKDYTPDLGYGIYVVSDSDNVGIDNVKTYVAEHIDDDSILLVKGEYRGKYTKCIYGEGREGYIVLGDDVPSTNIELEVCDIGDFLLYY